MTHPCYVRNPKLPKRMPDEPHRGDAFFNWSLVSAAAGVAAGLVVGFVGDVLGVGGLGFESSPADSFWAMLFLPPVFLILYVSGNWGIHYLYPPRKFTWSAQAETHKEHSAFPVSRRAELQHAYQAVMEAQTVTQLVDARRVYENTVNVLEKQDELRLQQAGFPALEEAKRVLDEYTNLNILMHKETRK